MNIIALQASLSEYQKKNKIKEEEILRPSLESFPQRRQKIILCIACSQILFIEENTK